jgi:murein DD-endopeptidase MepM/ murein hydrolase activator NlpD
VSRALVIGVALAALAAAPAAPGRGAAPALPGRGAAPALPGRGAGVAAGGALHGLAVTLHVVRPGETLAMLLKQFQTTRGSLEGLNASVNLDALKPGDRVRIPSRPGVFHTMQSGLTISDIATAYQVSPAEILTANEIMNPKRISIGKELFIPDGGPLTDDRRRRLVRQQRFRTVRAPRGAFGRPLEQEGRLMASDRFGHRTNPLTGEAQMHAGIDLVAPYGTPILAARDGVVEFAGWKGGYGRLVILQHEHGYETYYGHESEYVVKEGDHVTEGQMIGRVGYSGDATGPHLHFEVRIDGNPRNPERWMSRYL